MSSEQRGLLAKSEFERALASGPEGLERAAEALSVLRPELFPGRRSEYEMLEHAYDEAERAYGEVLHAR